jgi:hypothetical protein
METDIDVDELQLLIGISADPKFLQQVTYIVVTYDPKILKIDTCRAYHSGPVFPLVIGYKIDYRV